MLISNKINIQGYMYVNNSKNGSTKYEQAINFLEKGCHCACSTKVPKKSFA